jgi:hypothetical protein
MLMRVMKLWACMSRVLLILAMKLRGGGALRGSPSQFHRRILSTGQKPKTFLKPLILGDGAKPRRPKSRASGFLFRTKSRIKQCLYE